MAKVEKIETKKEIRIYTVEELESFDKELETYKVEREYEGRKFKCLDVVGELVYLKDKGIVKIHGKISDRNWGIYHNRVNEYTEHENKMRQLREIKGKREFGKQKELEQLDKVAAGMEFPEL